MTVGGGATVSVTIRGRARGVAALFSGDFGRALDRAPEPLTTSCR
jgi:hypothetical protein